MERKFISHDDITAWLDGLAEDHVVLVPMKDGGSVSFRPYVQGRTPNLDRQAVPSPKDAVFPQNETLLKYRFEKDPEHLDRTRIQVKETLPTEKTVVVGARPCGTRGMLTFDRVYDCDKNQDLYYRTRKENTLHVTVACTRVESTCFCHDVGSGPADGEGSDVLLVPVASGYVAEPITERGEALLAASQFKAAGDREAEAEAVKAATVAKLPEAHDYSDSAEKLMARFDDMEFWEEQSAKCISCGACTYLCPTCYCFNITDDTTGLTGRRLRSWDNCMSFQFTLEGSGHNPRPTKAHRLKNRVGHKFAYYPMLHANAIACCGCGRCIKSCPAGVDIRAIVKAAQNYTPKKEEGGDES
ncbi:MAG TPA: 4Fe-4S dicluster domain-containing protein [Desulfomicrobiaceae bacterium]|nr:4Fe-4S dicluster domain-containing protein [Desulfomicrobiaceae bacterium]